MSVPKHLEAAAAKAQVASVARGASGFLRWSVGIH